MVYNEFKRVNPAFCFFKTKMNTQIKNQELKLFLLAWYFVFLITLSFFLILINWTATKDSRQVVDLTFRNKELESQIKEMTRGYPIEKMAPFIAEKDKTVAAFLVSIAKKESDWGKHSPKLNGGNCYNYWGYRGGGERIAPGGYTCFSSEQEAVNAVGRRIRTLVRVKKLSTPARMIVWKCGATCAGHGRYSVQKWISDVDLYYQKFYN